MRLFSSICALLWALSPFVQAKSATGDRVLVVLEDAAEKENYQQFWADLECETNTTKHRSTDRMLTHLRSEILPVDIRIPQSRITVVVQAGCTGLRPCPTPPTQVERPVQRKKKGIVADRFCRLRTKFNSQKPARLHQCRW